MAKIVNPAVEAQPLVLLLAAEFEGGSRHLLDVGVARCRGDRCWVPYPVVEPGSVRCRLGRVLGQVVDDLGLGCWIDDPDVELLSPADGVLPFRSRKGEPRAGGGELECCGQLARLDGNSGISLFVVETDDCVQVDHPAPLELDHLDVGDLKTFVECLFGDAEELGEVAAEVDRGSLPELGRKGVEDHRTLVVVALETDRSSEGLVALSVARVAATGSSVYAGARGTVAGLSSPCHPVHGSKARGGEGGKGGEL